MTNQTLCRLSTSRGAPLARRLAARSLSSYSGILSFSSPESDFASGSTRQHDDSEWSSNLSYASPESDFNYGSLNKPAVEWSNSLSFASPEADFYKHALPRAKGPLHSNTLSFCSPEADYTARVEEKDAKEEEWSHKLSFASPDSDFTFRIQEDSVPLERYTMAYNWSFAGAESDSCSSHIAIPALANRVSRRKFSSSSTEKQLIVDPHEVPLPNTLQEAFAEHSRAVVITKPTAPFEIVDVNDAWVSLCGYTKEESRHETLDKLLQGPETNTNATKLLLDELLHGHEASTILTNYTKGGRKFENRVRVGTLRDAHNQVTHFVGVLEEVKDAADHWDKKHTKKQHVQA